MAASRMTGKFFPQIDIPGNLESSADRPFSPGRLPQLNSPKPTVTSPKRTVEQPAGAADLPDKLESDLGMFGKFKNMRALEEYSIYEPKGHDDKISFVSNTQSPIPGGDKSLALDIQKEEEIRKIYGKGYTLSILLTIFTTEFAWALEIVYITPFFLTLELNEWIDATFWMFPLLFATLLKAPISIIAGHRKYQRPILFIVMTFFVVGCLIFGCVDDISLGLLSWAERRVLMTWLGLVAFCFIDVANEMTSLIQNKVIEDNEQVNTSLIKKASITGSFAKIFGYFCGSLQALKISYYEIFERNMDSCFLFAAALMLCCMTLCYVFQSPPEKGYGGSLVPKFKSLKLSHFLPSFQKALSCSRKMKFILVSHFFGAGNIVMLSVYATSWVGSDVLEGDPEAEFLSKDSTLFEVGVSWGSLALMFTSFVILFMSYLLHRMVKAPQKSRFKVLHLFSQLLSSAALYACLALDSFNSIFLVIPLTGFAFQTFHSVPEILAEIQETEENLNVAGTYRRLLDFSFFYAQVLMFLVVPIVFIFFPDRNDNQWGMLVAASSGVLSAIFTLFI